MTCKKGELSILHMFDIECRVKSQFTQLDMQYDVLFIEIWWYFDFWNSQPIDEFLNRIDMR